MEVSMTQQNTSRQYRTVTIGAVSHRVAIRHTVAKPYVYRGEIDNIAWQGPQRGTLEQAVADAHSALLNAPASPSPSAPKDAHEDREETPAPGREEVKPVEPSAPPVGEAVAPRIQRTGRGRVPASPVRDSED